MNPPILKTTARVSRLPILALLWLVLVTGAFAQINPVGQMESVTPTELIGGQTATLNVRVRNIDVAAYFYVEFVSASGGWSVTPGQTSPQLINRNATSNFAFQVTPPGTTATGSLQFKLYGLPNDLNPPVITKLCDTKTFEVRAVLPPGAFELTLPEAFATNVDQPTGFGWSVVHPVETWTFELFDELNGSPNGQPILTKTDLTFSYLEVSSSDVQLVPGQSYFFQVTAHNGSLSTPASNGPRAFTMRESADIGAFEWIVPATYGATLSPVPRLDWTDASFATDYRVEIFNDNGVGGVQQPAILDASTASSQYQVAEGVLAGGRTYHVLITARNAGKSRTITGGVRRIEITSLGSFAAIYPVEGAVGVPQRPIFQWEESTGAGGYRFELYRVDGDDLISERTQILFGGQTTFLTYSTDLERDTSYAWIVTALTDTTPVEERPILGGLQHFTINVLSPFTLVYPAADQTGVEPVPTFRWNASTNAARYFLEVVRSTSLGAPDTSVILTPGVLPASPTEWRSFFEPFEKGKKYFWRVRAEDAPGTSIDYSQGGWSPFFINDINDFDLLLPSDQATGVSYKPRLSWNTVPNALFYRVYLAHQQLGAIGPFQTAGNVGFFQFDETLHLNGSSDYTWVVEAVSSTSSKFSRSYHAFTTGQRTFADSGDVMDQLLGKQLLGPDERAYINGIGGENKPIDIATFYFARQFE